MALGTQKVTAVSAPGMAAAATSRLGSGGRNVASVSKGPVEDASFSSQIGTNDNSLYRYEDELDLSFGEKQQEEARREYTPLMTRQANGFRVDEAEEILGSGGDSTFRNEVIRGAGLYERTLSITAHGTVKRGSILNYMY